MYRRKLNTQLFISYLLIILLVVLGIQAFFGRAAREFYYEQQRADLEARALLVSEALTSEILGNRQRLHALCRRLGFSTKMRVTLITQDGIVLADSDEDAAVMDNHGNRPEVKEALSGGVGTSVRFSNTLRQNMMYLAITDPERENLVIRTSLSQATLQIAISVFGRQILTVLLVITTIAAGVSYFISQRIVRPLEEMKEGADRFARGELDKKLSIPNLIETGSLAETLNEMAAQLDGRIKTILKQRNEQEAILASMVEGVITIDEDGHIATINHAAAQLFNLDEELYSGKQVTDFIHSSKLRKLIRRTLKSEKVIEKEIKISGEVERYVQIHGVRLKRGEDESGALIVLNDISRLKQLERIRRDFVANVSHELKTPITSIQGYVETLKEILPETAEEQSQRFLSIIVRQTERMNLIIDDLLHLARIEDLEERDKLEKITTEIRPILDSSIEDVRVRNRVEEIRFKLRCPDDLTAKVNSQLIRQAVTNLLDNAVNYGDESTIIVEGALVQDMIELRVKNSGQPISMEHQERLFERFYRIDKGRSRDMGGTGLGLAIVKHIALAHGGIVGVKSSMDDGTCFILSIPLI